MGSRQFAVAEALFGQDIRQIRKQLKMTQSEFARLINVSQKTVERWEGSDKPITGPVVSLVKILQEYPQISQELTIPQKEYLLRLWYMKKQDVCTIIDVDERKQKVIVHNYTKDVMARAFGKIESPTFEQYEEFLESRCFPRTRDKMKLQLRELDLPFYDPILIIQKTQGRMAEDDFWIKIER